MAKKPPPKPITRQFEYMGREARSHAYFNQLPIDADTKLLDKKLKQNPNFVHNTPEWNSQRKGEFKYYFDDMKQYVKENNRLPSHGKDPTSKGYVSVTGSRAQPNLIGLSDGNHRFQVAKDLKMKRVPVQFTPNAIDYYRAGPLIKDKTGHDPYNSTKGSKKMATKKKGGSGRKGGGKTPDWKKSNPQNPYNNAGPKVRASSTGAPSWDHYEKTLDRADNSRSNRLKKQAKAFRSGKNLGDAYARAERNPNSRLKLKDFDNSPREVRQMIKQADVDARRDNKAGWKALKGMGRKNAQARGVADYKRVVGSTPGQFSHQATMQKKPVINNGYAAKSGVSDYARYNDAKSRMGQRGMLGKGDPQSRLANAAGVGAGAASAAARVGVRTAFTNPVVAAGVTAYALASAANTKFGISRKIVDKIAPKYDPGVYRTNKASGQAYKTPTKKKKR